MIVYGVYLENKLVYIGKTIRSLSKRIYDHTREAKRSGYPFHNAILKHGINSFDFKILANCSDILELNLMEIKFISENKPKYNRMKGGNGGFEKGGETAKKVSASLKGHKSCNKWKPMSDEQKEKIRQALLKAYSEKRRIHYFTPEGRAKGLKNRNQSEISKRAIAKTNHKRWNTPIPENVVLYKSSLIDLEAEKSVTGRKRKGSVND